MNIRPSLFLFLLCLSFFVAVPKSSFAASPGSRAFDTDVETRIAADEMTFFAEEPKVLFQGDVHISRPDFELWSKTLTIYLKKENKKQETPQGVAGGLPEGINASDVERIVAEGNVRMKRDTSLGQSQKITYEAKTAVLTMSGNPSLTDGESQIIGTTIKYYLNESRSEVLGSPDKQVRVVFPGSKK